mmetsp:Transcript_101253/g.253822  ORF Transcript_101253/g.253822 Transcript_101253/m.253822 type:complete len:239 (-) Transcript_101253:92-808(-)|eukprot:CAMPEP_0115440560 /NCGR_PEP_ID=MMETSP0271-20121206/36361_1 /TAXON_ID=71861 /ORGANISM="Scrippsiella trochoidea, Strain CCMP3099" /LENGTH=238 /DNA_ID=CAMNT_0002866299 /DNA_START=49 /DNA_END=765 /DNA_ORIENTATION=+
MARLLRLSVGAAVVAMAGAQSIYQMAGLELKPEFRERASLGATAAVRGNASASDYYVFLQKFPLKGIVELFYHTEILVCPRSEFSPDDQGKLDGEIKGMTDFAEVDEAWWAAKTASCVELGYGGEDCSKECCGVGNQVMPLNKRQAVIMNADVSKKSLFIYGTGAFDGETAYHHTCDKKCWSNWAGTDYNVLKNNCNTFTSTVLFCVFGLSQKKPHLGISDTVTVSGKCPAGAFEVFV